MGEARRRKLLNPENYGKPKQITPGTNSLVISLIDEEQKVTLDRLLNSEEIEHIPTEANIFQLARIFFPILGRGLFCITERQTIAYTPVSLLRDTQTSLIELLQAYDPETQYCCHQQISPHDYKNGGVAVESLHCDLAQKQMLNENSKISLRNRKTPKVSFSDMVCHVLKANSKAGF